MPRPLFVSAALLFAAGSAPAQVLTVAGGKAAASDVVVSAPLPPGTPDGVNVAELPGGGFVPAQVTAPPLVPGGAAGKVVTFVLPALPAGGEVKARLGTNSYVKAPPAFKFVDSADGHTDLVFDGRPVLRYVNAKHDGSSPDRHDVTFKPFHHVFDPADGKELLTSGAYPFSAKDKKFPHHRGLFYGWMKINYGGPKAADTWHGRAGEYTQHEKTLLREAGEVLGRERSHVSWHGVKDDKTFADEEREVTAYAVPGGTLVDWASVLKTTLPKVTLDGDPQHAGFHFRATQEVSGATAKETYYIRPDGKDEPGKTRNWDPKTKQGPVNLPWTAMSFVTGGKRYTAVRMSHPDNPGEARHSERDYGRFGSYFVYDLTPETPLKVRYRVWVQRGELTKEKCEALYAAFATPPAVK